MFFRSEKLEPDPKAGTNIRGDAKSANQPIATAGKPDGAQRAQLDQRATKAKQLWASFGEIVALLMHTNLKSAPLSSLEQLVVPAIKTGQFVVGEGQIKRSGLGAPVAAVLWATVSKVVDRRLSAPGDSKSIQLDPSEWKSGDIPWLVLAAGDVRVIRALQQHVETKILMGRHLKTRNDNKKHKQTGAEPAAS